MEEGQRRYRWGVAAAAVVVVVVVVAEGFRRRGSSVGRLNPWL